MHQGIIYILCNWFWHWVEAKEVVSSPRRANTSIKQTHNISHYFKMREMSKTTLTAYAFVQLGLNLQLSPALPQCALFLHKWCREAQHWMWTLPPKTQWYCDDKDFFLEVSSHWVFMTIFDLTDCIVLQLSKSPVLLITSTYTNKRLQRDTQSH